MNTTDDFKKELLQKTIQLRDKNLDRDDALILVVIEAKRIGEFTREEVLELFEEAWRKRLEPFNLSDYGNAETLVYYNGADIRYCHGGKKGKWLMWDGERWLEDNKKNMVNLALITIRDMHNRTEEMPDCEEKDRLLNHWGNKAESVGKVKAMLKAAEAIPKIGITPKELDSNLWLFNCKNGTIDLKTGELRPHNRNDRITKMAPIPYHPDAKCPIWDTFLLKLFDGNMEDVKVLQRAIGYSLTGDTRDKSLYYIIGPTDSGKTTFVEIIRKMMGDYGKTTEFNSFVYRKSSAGAARSDIARLEGTRFVTASEVRKDEKFDDALLKGLTGKDTVVARLLYREHTEFNTQCKIFLVANDMPKTDDEALLNRIVPLPFKIRIPKEKQDKKLDQKLTNELPGILAWAVRGCLMWQEKKALQLSPNVSQALLEYGAKADIIKSFIRDSCRRWRQAHSPFSDLYDEFKTWCGRNRIHTPSKKAFSQALERKGFERGTIRIGENQQRIFRGLILRRVISEQLQEAHRKSLDNKTEKHEDNGL
jgi:putative DNA primase/helicase